MIDTKVDNPIDMRLGDSLSFYEEGGELLYVILSCWWCIFCYLDFKSEAEVCKSQAQNQGPLGLKRQEKSPSSQHLLLCLFDSGLLTVSLRLFLK